MGWQLMRLAFSSLTPLGWITLLALQCLQGKSEPLTLRASTGGRRREDVTHLAQVTSLV